MNSIHYYLEVECMLYMGLFKEKDMKLQCEICNGYLMRNKNGLYKSFTIF